MPPSVRDLADPLPLAKRLIERRSMTPADDGCMGVLEEALEALGFRCRRMRFGEVENMYARRGEQGPNLCWAGHVDVVPAGDLAAWTHPPFEAAVAEGLLWGRGAADMKGGIACWVGALARATERGDLPGSVSLLITGDEEGPAIDGTRKVVAALQEDGERIDACIVGEPSSVHAVGDTLKVGRRGSLNAWITAEGVQGHVAYPERAANPIPPLVRLLGRLQSRVLDEGWPEFPPSNLEVTTVDVGNPATNVIPARATARLNIRFNPAHRGADLIAWLERECAAAEATFGGTVRLETMLSGEAFLTEPGAFVDAVSEAVLEATGRRPELSTSGGTSDARFIRDLCPVVELGLVGTTIHQVDERVPLADLEVLTRVYERVIERFFRMAA